MKLNLIILLFIFTFSIRAAVPDTTGIPDKWKKESVIVLEHIYRAEETNIDAGRFREYNKIVFYIRDKFGLQQLSTFNIPTYIVPGAETQVGKIYKKNNVVIELTSKHLIPMLTKIDIGNKRKERSTRNADNGQKLAIPSLEVGDILEIEYYSKRKEFINYLDLSVSYPTLVSDASININRNAGSYDATIKFKPMNFPTGNVESTPEAISVKRKNIERTHEETLSDDNRSKPYLIIWKSYKSGDESGAFAKKKSGKYLEIRDEELKEEQQKLIRYIFENDMSEIYVSAAIEVMMDRKYKKITDTVAYLNDLFYLYREFVAAKSLTEKNPGNLAVAYDRYFVNVISRVLFNKDIPYKMFITQADYYGAPLSDEELISTRYGIYLERFNYYMFNPFLYAFPNQIPAYFESQTYLTFNANRYFYPVAAKKKYCVFGFWEGTFPHSNAQQNATVSMLKVNISDIKKHVCDIDLTISYDGKNKNRMTKNICSSTLLYEKSDSDYRKLVKKNYPLFLSNEEVEEELHDKYLKNYLLDDVRGDGYSTDKLDSYQIVSDNLYDANKPFETNCKFKSKDFVVDFDNYLILDAGKLLGYQLHYYNRDTVRRMDFYIPYKKMYAVKMEIEIPNGYTVENISDLNLSKITRAGKFESKAEIKDNKIYITTEKNYNFTDYPGKEEREVKAFIDKAVDFTQKKLILRKV